MGRDATKFEIYLQLLELAREHTESESEKLAFFEILSRFVVGLGSSAEKCD